MAKTGKPAARPNGRDPNWTWDEHTLALALYLEFAGRPPRKNDPAIVDLSRFLQHKYGAKARTERFRNVNGVYMKLMNFRRFDPAFTDHGRVGLPAGNDMEKTVWDRYAHDRKGLARAVFAVRDNQGVLPLPPIPEEDDEGVAEGSTQLREHKARERNREIIAKKKAAVLRDKGELRCEVCELRFDERYGGHGVAFIEVHHINPIALSKPGRKTRLADLACVCSNCHRMLHFDGVQTIEWLKTQLRPPSSEQGELRRRSLGRQGDGK